MNKALTATREENGIIIVGEKESFRDARRDEDDAVF